MPVIPREELTEYQRWQVSAFDAPTTRVEKISEPAPPPPASDALSDAGEPVSGIALPTAEDIERINREAHDEGFQQGFEAGRQSGFESGIEQARQQAEQMASMMQQFCDALAELDQAVADQLLELALETARQVVRSNLAVNPESILPVIREAVSALPLHHGNINVHLNPADAQLVHAQLGNQVAQSGWHLIEDRAMEAGGCLIRAGTSEVDATLATRWKRVLEAIGAPPEKPAEP